MLVILYVYERMSQTLQTSIYQSKLSLYDDLIAFDKLNDSQLYHPSVSSVQS